MTNSVEIIELVKKLSKNFTKIIHRNTLRRYKLLNWGDNGIGNRWAKKIFVYTVIYKSRKPKIYYSDDIQKDLEEIDNKIEQFCKKEQKINRGL